MSKHNRDVKFIIYQVLYIFVIVILTIKGADINLEKVVTDDETIKVKSYAEAMQKQIDSLLKLGLVPKIVVDSLINITDILKKDYIPPPLQIPSVTGVYIAPGNIQVSADDPRLKLDPSKYIVKPDETEKPPDDAIVSLPVVRLVQFTKNTLRNGGNGDLQVLGDGQLITTIPSGSSGTFQVMGQKTITYKQGGQSKNVETKENTKPEVTIQTFKAGGEESSLRELQAIIGFRVTIKDDYPQYKVTISGPVKFEDKGNGVYDIKLFYAGSKSEFESRTANMSSPFRASFNVTVKDEIAGHTVQRSGQYTFGDW